MATHSTNVVNRGFIGIELLRIFPVGELDFIVCGDENVSRADVAVNPSAFVKAL